VDVERRLRPEHGVRGGKGGRKGLHRGKGAVARSVHVREVEHGADPAAASRDLDHVLGAAELADASHHLDPERHRAVLALEPPAQLAQLLADRVERGLASAAEQEAGVEDDQLGAGRFRDPRRMVEHPGRHVQLLAALGVSHEAGDRRVHGERDSRLACQPAEPLREGVVHPELALEVDLAGRVAALLQEPDRLFRALA